MNAILQSLRALGVARLAAMGGVAAVTLGLLAFLAMRGGSERMALLYADLDPREAAQITEQLDRARIPHQEDAATTRVMVPEPQVARARLLLAKAGLPSGGSIGYEIFDRGNGLTESDFEQRINETRALEGELARSIRLISGVRGARVHLVLPEREAFSRDRQPAQASVLLTMAGGMRLDREGVQAVVNLVAAAVPGLKAQNISVIDSHGELLARAGTPLAAAAGAGSAEEVRRATEQRLSRAVEDMLAQVVGPGKVRAEAAVQMNFDRTQETKESYDPDGQVTRSQQTVTDTRKRTDSNGTVSVQNNLPNAPTAGTPPTGSQESRQEETTNYEIGKTVRTLVHEQPQISRISVAVLVDGVEAPGPNGKTVWRERTPQELAQIAALVRSAVGFDAGRGDKVDVVSLRFAAADLPPPDTRPGLLGLHFDKHDVMRLGETALLGVLALLALLLVLRPMALRLGAPALAAGADAAAAPLAVAAADATALPAPDGAEPGGLLEDQRMVDLANVEGQMRASSLRRVAELAERHPDETLAVMRGWMAQEEG